MRLEEFDMKHFFVRKSIFPFIYNIDVEQNYEWWRRASI